MHESLNATKPPSSFCESTCLHGRTAHQLCLVFLPDVEMLQASAGNPVSGESFSRPTKDSMIRKFLEGKLLLIREAETLVLKGQTGLMMTRGSPPLSTPVLIFPIHQLKTGQRFPQLEPFITPSQLFPRRRHSNYMPAFL